MANERCAGCGKDISIKPYTLVADIFEADDGNVYCKKCFKRYEKQKLIAKKSLEFEKKILESLPPEVEEKEEDEKELVLPNREDYANYIEYCLAYSIAADASDLHIKANALPVIRVEGTIKTIGEDRIPSTEVENFIMKESGTPTLKGRVNAIDFSLTYQGIRFRCNGYLDMHGWCISLRLLTIVSTDFGNLGIPEVIKQLAKRKSGLILVTGPTGSGKTTTLTCLVNYLNNTQKSHLIMLEDPIEFVHSNKNCIISQREIGRDTPSYSEAITEAMREDPDIILVGEMRDRDSIEAAIRAAETGHLVLSTLHTKGAGSSIDRVIDIFPPEQQNQIRTQLAMTLLGVISQQLIPSTKPGRRKLATEVMINTPAIQNLIRQEKTHLISTTIQISRNDGMYTMKSSLDTLFREGKITEENRDLYQI